MLLIILHTGWITPLDQAILSFVPSVLPAEGRSVTRQILMINKILRGKNMKILNEIVRFLEQHEERQRTGYQHHPIVTKRAISASTVVLPLCVLICIGLKNQCRRKILGYCNSNSEFSAALRGLGGEGALSLASITNSTLTLTNLPSPSTKVPAHPVYGHEKKI